MNNDRDEARDTIDNYGYTGFSLDQKVWYCTDHAISVLFNEDFQPLVDFATGKTSELKTPDGKTVYAWHNGSVEFLQAQSDLPEGIFCTVGNCPAEIYAPDDDFDDFNMPLSPEDAAAYKEYCEAMERQCQVSIKVGPKTDPYLGTCDLDKGHAGPHECDDPLGGPDRLKWEGGGMCAGDELPVRYL